MTVTQDLVRAEIAIAHVRKFLPEGATNRHDDIAHGGLMPMFQKFMMGEQQYKSWKSGHPGATRLEKIRARGAIAVGLGAGVCGEQADVAFCYLYDQGIRNMGYVNLWDDDEERLNHAFVVLGLPADFDEIRLTESFEPGAAPDIWGNNAVICDPWNNDRYHVDGRTWRLGFRHLLRSLRWSMAPASPMPDADERIAIETEVLAEANIVCTCLLYV